MYLAARLYPFPTFLRSLRTVHLNNKLSTFLHKIKSSKADQELESVRLYARVSVADDPVGLYRYS